MRTPFRFAAPVAGLLVSACGHSMPAAHSSDSAADTDTVAYFAHAEFGPYSYGMIPLTAMQAKGRWHSEMRSRNGVVTSSARVAPSGQIMWRASFTREGTLVRMRSQNAYGVETSTTTFADDGIVTTVSRAGVRSVAGCDHQRVTYDLHGWPVTRTCFDGEGHIVSDASGCPEHRLALDGMGQLISEQCADAEGHAHELAPGVYRDDYTLDDFGRRTMIRHFGGDGRPATHATGCAVVGYAFDSAGNPARWACIDGRGAVVRATHSTFDENGCALSESNVTGDDRPMLFQGVAKTIWARDTTCSVLDVETRGLRGELVGAVATRSFTLDAEGKAVVERCSDAHKQWVQCGAGVGTEGASIHTDYDARGRVVRKEAFYGDNRPSRFQAEGSHAHVYAYDDDGRVARLDYLDIEGTPSTETGVASERFRYDSIGAVVSTAAFDREGHPVVSGLGCHEIRSTFDSHHLLAMKECFDTEGHPHGAHLCEGPVCWAPGSARVVIERHDGQVDNAHYDATGALMGRISCEKTPCFR